LKLVTDEMQKSVQESERFTSKQQDLVLRLHEINQTSRKQEEEYERSILNYETRLAEHDREHDRLMRNLLGTISDITSSVSHKAFLGPSKKTEAMKAK